LFNAGNEWEQALAGPAIASYATSVVDLYANLPARIEGAERPDLTIVGIVAEAKEQSTTAGFSPAIAVAERALLRLILATGNGLTQPSASAFGDRWREARGPTPNALVARFTGELFSEYAQHVVDREAGRLAARQQSVSETAAALAGAVHEIAQSVARRRLGTRPITPGAWSSMLHEAFIEGRALPAPA